MFDKIKINDMNDGETRVLVDHEEVLYTVWRVETRSSVKGYVTKLHKEEDRIWAEMSTGEEYDITSDEFVFILSAKNPIQYA